MGNASQAAQTLEQRIQMLISTIKQMQSSGKSLEVIEAALRRTGQFRGDEIRLAMQRIRQEIKETEQEVKKSESTWSKFGNKLQYIAATVLGFSLVNVLQKVIGLLRQSIDLAIDFSRALFTLEIGVRGLQRLGLDITIEEINSKMEELGETFRTLSEDELAKGMSIIISLTRQLGFTKEQIFQVADAAAVLSQTSGRTFADSAESISRAISSGYNRSLREMGIAISVAEIQQEALRMGVEESYQSMTLQERAAAALNVILRNLAPISEDASKFQTTLAGSLEQTTEEMGEQATHIGSRLLPIWDAFLRGVLWLLNKFKEEFDDFIRNQIDGTANLYGFLIGMAAAFTAAINGNILSLEELKIAIQDAQDQMREFLDERFFPEPGQTFDDMPIPLPDPGDVADQAEEINDIVEELYEDLNQLQLRYQQDLRDIGIDLQRDLAEIERRGADKREQIWQDYYRKLEEIAIRTQQKIADAQRRYQDDLEKLQRDTADKIEDAQEDFREDEIKAEQDFQEKMRRLRDEFLFDLEDALRERDALQVLRLIRRFNMEREALEREREQEKEDRERRLEDEIADIQEDRARREEELRIELENRLRDIQINAQREREAEKRSLDRRLQDLRENLAQQRRERQIQAQQQIADLTRELQDRLELLAQGLVDEYNITVEMLDAIMAEYQYRFGAGGLLDQIYNYMYQRVLAMAQLGNIVQGITGGSGNTGIPLDQYNPEDIQGGAGSPGTTGGGTGNQTFAEGGVMIATRPTTVKMGDNGIEMARFTPLQRRGNNEGRVFGDAFGTTDKIEMLVALTPGLQAEIIDSTLEVVSDVIIEERR